ncbi:MAG: hypothetical protein ACYC46_16110 [Acidobacteriaceae bacterium]
MEERLEAGVFVDLREQRRYEMAKELYIQGILRAGQYVVAEAVAWAFDMTDVFMAELEVRNGS